MATLTAAQYADPTAVANAVPGVDQAIDSNGVLKRKRLDGTWEDVPTTLSAASQDAAITDNTAKIAAIAVVTSKNVTPAFREAFTTALYADKFNDAEIAAIWAAVDGKDANAGDIDGSLAGGFFTITGGGTADVSVPITTKVAPVGETDPIALAALTLHENRQDIHVPAPSADGKVPVSSGGVWTEQDRLQVSPANYIVGFGTPATLAPPKAAVYYEQLDATEGANNVWGPTDAAGAFPAQADNRSADILVLQDAKATAGVEFTEPRRMSLQHIDQRVFFNGKPIDLRGSVGATLTPVKWHNVDNTTTLDLTVGNEFDRAALWNVQTKQLTYYQHDGTTYQPEAEDHEHTVLDNIAVYIYSAGTNAGSQAAIEFFDIDGVAYPPTDWTVSSSATGVASRTGNVTPPFVDQAFTGTYVMAHNKNDFIYFKYIGDNANGLSAITYAGTNGAQSDGQIIVNFAGTNYHVDFANKAAVTATEFTTEAEAATPIGSLIELNDTPAAYTDGTPGDALVLNPAGDGFEFADPPQTGNAVERDVIQANRGSTMSFGDLQFRVPSSGNSSLQMRSPSGVVAISDFTTKWSNQQGGASENGFGFNLGSGWAYFRANGSLNLTLHNSYQDGTFVCNGWLYRVEVIVGSGWTNNRFSFSRWRLAGVKGDPGTDGTNGTDGVDAASVDHISRTAGDSSPGTTDTYTLWADAAETTALGTYDVPIPSAQGVETTLLAQRTGTVYVTGDTLSFAGGRTWQNILDEFKFVYFSTSANSLYSHDTPVMFAVEDLVNQGRDLTLIPYLTHGSNAYQWRAITPSASATSIVLNNDGSNMQVQRMKIIGVK